MVIKSKILTNIRNRRVGIHFIVVYYQSPTVQHHSLAAQLGEESALESGYGLVRLLAQLN